MSRPAAQRADGRRNRDAILAAAERLLLSGEEVSVSALAREAGLTRATFYRHFASGDDVLDALARSVAATVVPALLGELEPLALGDALDRLAHGVVGVVGEHRHVLAAQSRSIEELARLVVPDEPVAAFFAERRARGELTSSSSDGWLARCVRALCLTAVTDERAPDLVAGDLAATLRRLVG